jgi:hypothetical protein
MKLTRVHRALAARWPLVATIAVFLALALLLLPWFRYLVNPDATAYVSLAHKWAELDLKGAVNGYWGPGLPAIMAPFIAAGATDFLLIAKLVAVGCGIAILLLLDRIFDFFKTRQKPRLFLYVPIIPVLLNWSLVQPITADLLFAAAALFMFWRAIIYLQQPTRMHGVLLGIGGAALYFAKPLGFYAAGAAFAVMVLVTWARQKKKNTRTLWTCCKNLILPAAVFLLLSAPWIVALSMKYDKPAVATSSRLNHALVGPNLRVNPNPVIDQVIAPPNDTAVSSWEDPSDYPLEDWKVISRTNLLFSIGLLFANTYMIFTTFNMATVFGAAIFAAVVFWRIVQLVRKDSKPGAFDFLLGISIVIMLAYIPILTLERYMYGSILMVYLLAVVLFSAPLAKLLPKAALAALLAVLLVSTAHPVITQMHRVKNYQKDLAVDAAMFRQYLPKGSHVVSNEVTSIYICMHMEIQCYGVIPNGTDPQTAVGLLNQHGLRYFMYFGDIGALPGWLAQAKILSQPNPTIHLLQLP